MKDEATTKRQRYVAHVCSDQTHATVGASKPLPIKARPDGQHGCLAGHVQLDVPGETPGLWWKIAT